MTRDGIRICFVCAGNICRSPTAEGIMRALLDERGLSGRVEVDSAGTGGWHAGEQADPRARAAAAARGVVLTSIARRFEPEDFDEFDLVLAMDLENVVDLTGLAVHDDHTSKIRLLREFDPDARDDLEVPDPYYTYEGEDGFGVVFDMCLSACAGLLAEICEGPEHGEG